MAEVDVKLAAIVRGRVGTTVCGGKYKIDGVLGIGGMAAVYAGTHRNGRPVAIKLLHPEYSRRADICKRFLREGQAANAVQHRGVVAVIDDDVTEDGAAFVVMERLQGRTLEQLWEELGRRLPASAVLAIGRELCGTLAAAHRSGIIHRDLKPENLFLTNDGELKVLDFGLAQLRDAARPKETQTGMILGTPAFMPPEQASGQTSKIDARTDLWAVGATMFTLLSGKLVHDGETARHFVMLAAMEPARSLAVAMPSAHPALVALVDRALARDKDQRWQSAESMRDAIVSLSERLFGEREPPLMNPLALTAAAAPRREESLPRLPGSSVESTFEPTKLALVADLTDDADDGAIDQTTTDGRALVLPTSDSGPLSDEGTRVGVPDFADVGKITDTQPSPQRTAPMAAHSSLPRLGEGSTDSLVDSTDLPMPLEGPSWTDPFEQRRSLEGPVRRAAPSSEPTFDQAQRESDGLIARPSTPHLGMRPTPRTRPSSIPQDARGLPALLALLGGARDPRAASMYLPIVVAAIVLGVSLAYFLARGCRAEPPPQAETPTITPPDAPSVSPSASENLPEHAPSSKALSSSSAVPVVVPTPSSAAPPVAPHPVHEAPKHRK